MDKDRESSRTSKNAANSLAHKSSQASPTRGLALRSELNSLISGNSSPISNNTEARKWLDSKGWVLSEEPYDRLKMVKILLTASLIPKVPAEAANAIRAVAYVLDDDMTDNISSSLTNAVAIDQRDLDTGMCESSVSGRKSWQLLIT